MSTGAIIQRLRGSLLPFCLPAIGEDEIAEVADCLRSGRLTDGDRVQRFEREFAAFVGAEHAVALNSGTMAMQLSLEALGIGMGDEVILPVLSSCATANVIVHLGARPVLVDVDASLLMDLDRAEGAITARTRVILPVHFGGQSCDMEGIAHLARRFGLFVVEDAAHAAGCAYQGVKIGTQGDAVVFDFCDANHMTTGEGGMVTTYDGELAARIRRLARHGMSSDCEVVDAGYNGGLTEVAAGVGIHQLRRLPGFIHRRQEIARRYREAFGGLEELTLPVELADRDHVFEGYKIVLEPARMTISRDRFVEELRAARIGATVGCVPVHLHPFYASAFDYRRGDFPVAERIHERLISLPCYSRMTDEDVDDVIDAVRTTVLGHRRAYPG